MYNAPTSYYKTLIQKFGEYIHRNVLRRNTLIDEEILDLSSATEAEENGRSKKTAGTDDAGVINLVIITKFILHFFSEKTC